MLAPISRRQLARRTRCDRHWCYSWNEREPGLAAKASTPSLTTPSFFHFEPAEAEGKTEARSWVASPSSQLPHRKIGRRAPNGGRRKMSAEGERERGHVDLFHLNLFFIFRKYIMQALPLSLTCKPPRRRVTWRRARSWAERACATSFFSVFLLLAFLSGFGCSWQASSNKVGTPASRP